jgi:predicted neutral ceramidase superfamily lipid hydrolase
VRNYVESLWPSPLKREMFLVVSWSLILSICATASQVFTGWQPGLAQSLSAVALVTGLTTLVVTAYLTLVPPQLQSEQTRGVLAGIAVRGLLFCALFVL